ncbi:MAG: hypothetical protein R3A10_14345 [Caldilineaceae bacterium]
MDVDETTARVWPRPGRPVVAHGRVEPGTGAMWPGDPLPQWRRDRGAVRAGPLRDDALARIDALSTLRGYLRRLRLR